jgi:hypothetical protein
MAALKMPLFINYGNLNKHPEIKGMLLDHSNRTERPPQGQPHATEATRGAAGGEACGDAAHRRCAVSRRE